jgi:hypothetical protein
MRSDPAQNKITNIAEPWFKRWNQPSTWHVLEAARRPVDPAARTIMNNRGRCSFLQDVPEPRPTIPAPSLGYWSFALSASTSPTPFRLLIIRA